MSRNSKLGSSQCSKNPPSHPAPSKILSWVHPATQHPAKFWAGCTQPPSTQLLSGWFRTLGRALARPQRGRAWYFFWGGFSKTIQTSCAGQAHVKVRQGVKNFFFQIHFFFLIFDQKSGQKRSKNWSKGLLPPFFSKIFKITRKTISRPGLLKQKGRNGPFYQHFDHLWPIFWSRINKKTDLKKKPSTLRRTPTWAQPAHDEIFRKKATEALNFFSLK